MGLHGFLDEVGCVPYEARGRRFKVMSSVGAFRRLGLSKMSVSGSDGTRDRI